MLRFRRIGLIAKTNDPQVGYTLRVIYRHLLQKDLSVVLDSSTQSLLSEQPTVARQSLGEQCDLVIVIGGDGTLLGAARDLVEFEVPIVGVNLGRLGFLVDVSPDDKLARLNEILAGDFITDERFLLSAAVVRDQTEVESAIALNDVVIRAAQVVRVLEYETYIDGRFVNMLRGDGIVVSTPTGSTAYSVSAGGPVLWPTLDAVVVQPICPHTLSSRPIVVSNISTIEIQLTNNKPTPARLVFDGANQIKLRSRDLVRIHRMHKPIKLLHPSDFDFYHILREKLRWG